MDIRRLPHEATIELRHQVLRAHQPRSACYYPNDEEKTALHLGVYMDNQLVSIASYFKENTDKIESEHQYRLRGMATLPEYRRQKAGSALVHRGLEILGQRGAETVWFNARVSALPFYEALGFVTIGEEFEIEPIGPHYVLYKQL